MKVIVKVSAGKRSYSEDVTDEQKEYFQEISTNGANPKMEDKTLEWWVRPIKCKASEVDKYNSGDDSHFIFGWFECFAQSDNVPQWVYDAEELELEVVNE